MPELPEVEIIVRGLKRNIIGLKIKEFKIINKKLRYDISDKMRELYNNKLIKYIFRIGKYGIIILSGKHHIMFHLGMTGKFRFSKYNGDVNKHDHILIKFNKGIVLKYNDVRKFGYFTVLSNPINLYKFKNLGKEPFLLKNSSSFLWTVLRDKKKNIKSLLLDQSFIAGIGNIYASEILFDSKIYPFEIAHNLSKKSFYALLNSTEKVLKKAISKGGVTIKDYQNIDGDLGYFKNSLKVYGREGLTCFKCQNLIIKIKTNGRSTFYCKNCQKKI